MKARARSLETAARAALAAWTALTCVYAALCGVSFAWKNFLEPRYYPAWVAAFLTLHALFTAAALGLAGAALPRRRAWFIGSGLVVACWIVWPLRALVPGAAATLIAAWAVLPLLVWESLIAARRAPLVDWDAAPAAAGAGGRLAGAALAGAAVAVSSSVTLSGVAGFGHTQRALVAGASALQLAVLFAAVAAVLEALRRGAGAFRRPRAALAAAESLLSVLLLRAVIARILFDAVELRGRGADATAWAWASAAAAAWTGQALARREGTRTPSEDFLLAPLGARAPLWGRVVLLAAAAAAPALVKAGVGALDWNGVIVALTVAAAWLAAFACCRPARNVGGDKPAAALAAALIAAAWLGAAASAEADPLLRLRGAAPADLMTRASAVDPSLKLARRATQWSAATSFFETLRRNTNITRDEKIAPKQIDLVEGALVQPVEKPPIFIFVIDSLRQDYVGAYNPAVRFSPQIDAFAKDSLLWKNAFTAYGATGLSEPSIWAGSLLIHRQYVTPFAPMNSLERLVDALGYRKFMTVDAIVDELWTKGPDLTDIDEKTPGFYSLCESLKHVEERLDSAAPDRPVFVYSQPQDVHLSSIKRSGGGNVGGHPYPGFNEPYASRVERLDACFGAFIGSLKRRGLYDKSLIILTADHGDALGDEGRWGHAATIFPEIMHIPMITHLPKDLAARAKVDLEGPAFLIDLAPTLYQLLGQGPPRLDPLLGRPLASLGAQDPESWRKPEQMVVSSYGPAYGIIREGKSFFIGDGVNFRYYQYDLSTDPAGKNNLISAVSTKDGEQAVLAWLDRLNAFWGRK